MLLQKQDTLSSELPGAIKTGCPETPAFMSKFCYNHSAIYLVN